MTHDQYRVRFSRPTPNGGVETSGEFHVYANCLLGAYNVAEKMRQGMESVDAESRLYEIASIERVERGRLLANGWESAA